MTPDEAAAALTAPTAPYLIGVRHHSPSLAAAVPALLDAARPQVLLVELPADFQDWLGWLAHPDTVAPVALAAVPGGRGDGPGPAFYPFADFSPELAALLAGPPGAGRTAVPTTPTPAGSPLPHRTARPSSHWSSPSRHPWRSPAEGRAARPSARSRPPGRTVLRY
ncbi:DUF5682 family protein [Streptomyces sp. NPDC000878]